MISGIIDSSQKIITDGLVLHLDAAQLRSYPGSGTTWTDLSGNGNNGTLTNGPTFNSSNGGSIVFDGTNDYVSISSMTYNDYTLDIWYKMFGNDGGYGYFTAGTGSIGTAVNHGFGISEGGTCCSLTFGEFFYVISAGGVYAMSAFIPSTTSWNHICFIQNKTTGYIQAYGNGALLANNFITANNMATVTSVIAMSTAATHHLRGNLSSFKFYNRALTAQEVLQNFDALKSRYGL